MNSDNNQEQRVTIHQGLIRPVLWWGADRQLGLTLVLICTMAGFSGLGWNFKFSAAVALTLFVVGLWILRRMAKKDPYMLRIYLRHTFQYHDWYEPRAGAFAKPAKVHRWVPIIWKR